MSSEEVNGSATPADRSKGIDADSDPTSMEHEGILESHFPRHQPFMPLGSNCEKLRYGEEFPAIPPPIAFLLQQWWAIQRA
jgi:hypothetical protein